MTGDGAGGRRGDGSDSVNPFDDPPPPLSEEDTRRDRDCPLTGRGKQAVAHKPTRLGGGKREVSGFYSVMVVPQFCR